MSSARAAINAALEAARSASRGQQPQPKRPTAQSQQAAAQSAAPERAAPPQMTPGPAPAAPQATPAAAPPPWQQAAPSAPAAPSAALDQGGTDSEPPSWVMAFSDDTAVAQDAPAAAAVSAPVAARAAAAPRPAYVITPVEQIGWDGNWPALAAGLPLRGVSQQLAFQTELIECVAQGNVATFRLRVPIDTLRASGNSEKLAAALQERFPDIKVALETELGPVWYTASAEAQAQREQAQRAAEDTVNGDAFVQHMVRTFDAFVVPGSVKPAPAA